MKRQRRSTLESTKAALPSSMSTVWPFIPGTQPQVHPFLTVPHSGRHMWAASHMLEASCGTDQER